MEYMCGARRFDAGGRPNPIGVPMLLAALQQVVAWGPPRIYATARAHAQRIAVCASEVGLVVPGEFTHIIGIRGLGDDKMHPNGPGAGVAPKLYAFLKERRVLVSLRAGAVRVSPSVYNTEQEIDVFCELLREFVRSTAMPKL